MNAKQKLLIELRSIISEQLGVREEAISNESGWAHLGADSLDRMQMSLAIERAFEVDIPHPVGEHLNTVGETIDHLLALIRERTPISVIRIEPAITSQHWAEMTAIRTQVFTKEYGFSFQSLPGPGEKGVWHFLARDNHEAVGTLSVVDTTGDRKVHQLYQLVIGENDRVARYSQLAILKAHRKRGIFKMLTDAAQSAVIRPNGFTVGWLLYPASHARSSVLTENLGFTQQRPLRITEYGSCHVLIRRESTASDVRCADEPAHQRLAIAK